MPAIDTGGGGFSGSSAATAGPSDVSGTIYGAPVIVGNVDKNIGSILNAVLGPRENGGIGQPLPISGYGGNNSGIYSMASGDNKNLLLLGGFSVIAVIAYMLYKGKL